MLVVALLLLALLIVAAVYVVRIYNGLVALRENVRKAWSNIDVLLTQRTDELPKLVETCKRYMAYEQETLERVMQARSAVSRASSMPPFSGVSTNCAPNAAMVWRRSIERCSGITSTMR